MAVGVSRGWRHRLRGRLLDLRGLPRPVQALAGLSLAAAGLAALGVLLVGEDVLPIRGGVPQPRLRQWPLDLFGVDVFVSNVGISRQSWLVTALVYTGLAVGSSTLAYGALQRGWRWPRLTLVFVALGGSVCAALHKTIADRLATFPDSATVGSLSSGLLRYEVAGWAGFAFVLALVLVPLRLQRRAPLAAACAAGAPFALGLLAWATAGDGGYPSESLGGIQRLKGLGAGVAYQVSDVATLVLALLLLWGVVEAVRASRDAALAGEAVASGMVVLAPLLAAKLVWVGIGLGGALPDALGGASPIWAHSRGDGPASWALATGLGIAFGALLALRPKLREGLTPVAGLVAVALVVATSAVQFLADTVETTLHAWWDRERYPLLGWFVEWWSDYSVGLTVALLALAAPAGLLLLRRSRTLGLFLVLLGAWALPRAIGVGIDLFREPRGAVADGTLIEQSNRFAWVDLVTLDVVLTIAVALLAFLWWTGRQRAVEPRALLLVLLASTLATYTAQLAPNALRVGHLFYLGIVFPLAYQFLFDSEALNERRPARRVRVLAATGLAAVAVAAALSSAGTAHLSPVRPSATNIGLSVYKAPLLLLVLLASLPLVARSRRA